MILVSWIRIQRVKFTPKLVKAWWPQAQDEIGQKEQAEVRKFEYVDPDPEQYGAWTRIRIHFDWLDPDPGMQNLFTKLGKA